MNMEFMDEYYERMRADDIEKLSSQRNDEYEERAMEYSAAKNALIEGLGLGNTSFKGIIAKGRIKILPFVTFNTLEPVLTVP